MIPKEFGQNTEVLDAAIRSDPTCPMIFRPTCSSSGASTVLVLTVLSFTYNIEEFLLLHKRLQ